MNEIQDTVSEFILKSFLPGASREELTDSTPLITGGILDSLSILKLTYYLEEHYHIELDPQERITQLDTISDIAQLVSSKQQKNHVKSIDSRAATGR